MMNLAFPKSAWVSTAVWQAQKAGDLPPDALAQRDDLTPQARASLQLMRVTWLLKSLAKRLDVAAGAADRPAIAVVLMGPMLWSRVEPRDGAIAARAQIHVGGPEPGDVVLVTDTPAIEAIVGGGHAFRTRTATWPGAAIRERGPGRRGAGLAGVGALSELFMRNGI